MEMIKTISGIAIAKGEDKIGPFITLRHRNKYGLHEIEFEIPPEDAELYDIGQVATMTMEFKDEVPAPPCRATDEGGELNGNRFGIGPEDQGDWREVQLGFAGIYGGRE